MEENTEIIAGQTNRILALGYRIVALHLFFLPAGWFFRRFSGFVPSLFFENNLQIMNVGAAILAAMVLIFSRVTDRQFIENFSNQDREKNVFLNRWNFHKRIQLVLTLPVSITGFFYIATQIDFSKVIHFFIVPVLVVLLVLPFPGKTRHQWQNHQGEKN